MIFAAIILIVLLSALFSGLEIAFITSDKLRLEIDNKQGKWYALIISRFVKIPQKFIATLIIANNIALVIYGILAVNILELPLSRYVQNTFLILVLQTVISSVVILFFGEFLPKSLFRVKANSLLYFFALPSLIIYYTFYPLTYFFISLSNLFIRIFFKKHHQHQGEYIISKADIQELINQNIEQNSNDNNYELKIFQNALTFDQVKLKECIIPRTEIVAIEINSSIQQVKEVFIETGFSKLIVYQDNIDHVVGIYILATYLTTPPMLKVLFAKLLLLQKLFLPTNF